MKFELVQHTSKDTAEIFAGSCSSALVSMFSQCDSITILLYLAAWPLDILECEPFQLDAA